MSTLLRKQQHAMRKIARAGFAYRQVVCCVCEGPNLTASMQAVSTVHSACVACICHEDGHSLQIWGSVSADSRQENRELYISFRFEIAAVLSLTEPEKQLCFQLQTCQFKTSLVEYGGVEKCGGPRGIEPRTCDVRVSHLRVYVRNFAYIDARTHLLEP